MEYKELSGINYADKNEVYKLWKWSICQSYQE